MSEITVRRGGRFWDYLELTKPRLTLLVVLSVWVGFFMACEPPLPFGKGAFVMIGTMLVAASAQTFNQWMERGRDRKMRRTESRPLPSGRIEPAEAFIFGLFLAAAGFIILILSASAMTAGLAALTLITYLFLYTPLKSQTSLCTLAGAIPGAIPPLIGWSAARGRLSYEAWILAAILFLWQMPHFLAIAHLYREDFRRAGFRMLSVEDPDGRLVGRQMILYAAALLPVSLLPSLTGMAGAFYFFFAFLSGSALLGVTAFNLRRLDQKAKLLFRASIAYLAGLLVVMMADKAPLP